MPETNTVAGFFQRVLLGEPLRFATILKGQGAGVKDEFAIGKGWGLALNVGEAGERSFLENVRFSCRYQFDPFTDIFIPAGWLKKHETIIAVLEY